MIRITSKRHNFRRCGVAHPKGPVEYPDGRFSEAELKVLAGEPMLTVEKIPDEEGKKDKGKKDKGQRTKEKGQEG